MAVSLNVAIIVTVCCHSTTITHAALAVHFDVPKTKGQRRYWLLDKLFSR